MLVLSLCDLFAGDCAFELGYLGFGEGFLLPFVGGEELLFLLVPFVVFKVVALWPSDVDSPPPELRLGGGMYLCVFGTSQDAVESPATLVIEAVAMFDAGSMIDSQHETRGMCESVG